MHDPDLILPWFTNHWWTLGVFIISSTVFHIFLVRLFPLSSLRWKQVDYIWLTMALVGIVGSVGINRAAISENLVVLADARVESALTQVVGASQFGTSHAICRVFEPSEASPPQDVMAKIQHEYDAQCAWFKKLAASLRVRENSSTAPINVVQLVGPFTDGGEPWAYSNLSESVVRYNNAVDDRQRLKEAKKSDALESVLRFLGPLLIALALALRITKVTAEVAHERTCHRSKI